MLTNVALNVELVFQQLNALLNGERELVFQHVNALLNGEIDCRAGLSTVECLAEW